MNKIKILFVCMGNICRSPTAEGIFNQLLNSKDIKEQFIVDSAGTHAHHIGDTPDLRAQKAAKDRGIDLSYIRARKIQRSDFAEFDHILVMDDENYENVMKICPDEYSHKIAYLLDYAPELKTREVPDPYYGGSYGFDRVLDMLESATEGLLIALQTKEDME